MTMADRLQVSTDDVTVLSARMAAVADAFERKGADAAEVASLIQHDALRSAVMAFASSWDDRRGQLRDALRSAASGATACAAGFENLDDGLAREMRR